MSKINNEITCMKCNGLGYIIRNVQEVNIKIQCRKCNGYGEIDWLENLTKKEEYPTHYDLFLKNLGDNLLELIIVSPAANKQFIVISPYRHIVFTTIYANKYSIFIANPLQKLIDNGEIEVLEYFAFSPSSKYGIMINSLIINSSGYRLSDIF